MRKVRDGQGSGSLSGYGVCLSPEAKRCLEKALHCLEGGLLVTSWHWTEKARAELDKLTEGQPASFLVESEVGRE